MPIKRNALVCRGNTILFCQPAPNNDLLDFCGYIRHKQCVNIDKKKRQLPCWANFSLRRKKHSLILLNLNQVLPYQLNYVKSSQSPDLSLERQMNHQQPRIPGGKRNHQNKSIHNFFSCESYKLFFFSPLLYNKEGCIMCWFG